MELPTIQEEYDAYVKGSYAREPPKDQYDEMKRAFFAGMAILYNRFSDIQKLPVTEEEHDRLKEFFYHGFVYCFDDVVKNLPKEMENHLQGKFRMLVIEEFEAFFRGWDKKPLG